MIGLVDTNIVVHLFRRLPAASAWLQSQGDLGVTFIAWMEVMDGAPGKSGQAASRSLLDGFELVYPTQTDIDWAMQQLVKYRLSHGVSINDCLIASASHRLQIPTFTFNLSHFTPLIGSLAQRPYG